MGEMDGGGFHVTFLGFLHACINSTYGKKYILELYLYMNMTV